MGAKVFGLIFVFTYWFSPENLNVGYEPKQPINYSHALHAGELGIDCRYCHGNVDQGERLVLPAAETCLNCHSMIKKDSPEIMKIRKSVADNVPIEWVKVHHLADYAYFDHSRHVKSGMGCATCHGNIHQQEVVRQSEPLSMGWCLDCHRNPEQYVRPKSEITNMDWKAEDQAALGKELVATYHLNPKQDCSVCHR